MGLRQLGDVENDADSQIELPEDGPQLWDQIELHDLTQQGVISGRMGFKLRGRDREKHILFKY